MKKLAGMLLLAASYHLLHAQSTSTDSAKDGPAVQAEVTSLCILKPLMNASQRNGMGMQTLGLPANNPVTTIWKHRWFAVAFDDKKNLDFDSLPRFFMRTHDYSRHYRPVLTSVNRPIYPDMFTMQQMMNERQLQAWESGRSFYQPPIPKNLGQLFLELLGQGVLQVLETNSGKNIKVNR